ncbi:pentapeptide repeat-containing protein [Aequorivita sp. Q41]|uniref:pentapeptide repeat-containing protein n=1 Tax=Aequorivita sp. Q41 TaxID=3153300 RepID=UPI003242E3F9
MERQFIEEQTFEGVDFSKDSLEKGDYELCVFLNCNFSNIDLSLIRFIECEFKNCNLSSAKLNKTGFQSVVFIDCKMFGLHFEKCDTFGFSIEVDNSQLNYSSFYGLKLPKTKFNNCKFLEVDFSECNLHLANFNDCNLQNAVFSNTSLKDVDFRSSYEFSIDPENNNINGAKFSFSTVAGLLTKYNITIDVEG